MTHKFLYLFIFCASLFSFTQAQVSRGTIHGSVHTNDGAPAREVTVRIENTGWGTITDGQGNYRIEGVRAGTWTVAASAVASTRQTKKVTLEGGQRLRVDFTLSASAAQLNEVVVTTLNDPKQSEDVAKMPLRYLENPQVYNTVSSEIMTQQGITSYDDIFRNVPGITRTWESTGRAGDGAAYFTLRGFDAQPALVNGLPSLTSGDMDPADVEKVEVIKGPSGTLFGGSFYSYGGLINTVTKKPYYTFGGEVAYHMGSFGLNRVTADVNMPLSKDQKIALRLNTAYHSEGSFQDAGFKKSFFIAPAFSYEVNDRLSFEVLTEIMEENRAVVPVFFNSDRISPLPFKDLDALNLNTKLSFTSNDLTIRNPKFNLQAQMHYKLSEHWNSQTVISRGTIKSDGIYTYIWDDTPDDNYFSQYFHNEQQTTYTTDIQQNFNGDFMLGKLRNRLLIGLDFYNIHIIDQGSGWAWGRNVTPQGDVNYINPFSGETMPPLYLTKASVDNLLASESAPQSNLSNSSYSAYVSDVLNITPNLLAMASVRADYYDSKGDRSTDEDNFNQWAFSPKFGLVYQPLPGKLSLFANYMNAFINVAPADVFDENGGRLGQKSFKPEHANQTEVGIKASLAGGKFQATVSAYDIRVADRVTPDPLNMNNSVQGGKVGSRGIELDLDASPFKGFYLIAGYAYNETRIIAGNKKDFYSEPGRSIGGQGPQNLANLWATYEVSNGALRHLGFGLGGNYGSTYKVIDNSVTGVFLLPAYAVGNVAVYYHRGPVRVTLNVNNFTNEKYYSGYWSVNPQKPINFALGLAYAF